MATTRTVAVAPTDPGGYDAHYTSLNNAIASEDKDLVSLDRVLVIECHAMTDTTAVTVTGFTTDETRYVHIKSADGAEATAQWDEGGSRYLLDPNSPTNHALVINQSNCRIERIQVANAAGSASAGGVVCATSGVVLHGVFVRMRGTGAPGFDVENLVLENCIAWGGAWGFDGSGVTYRNCTAYGATNGIRGLGGSIAHNVVAYGNTTDWAGNNFSYDASSGNNAGGTNATHPRTPYTQLTEDPFVDAANGDFRLAEGSALIDLGTALSAHFTDDINGNTRSGTWDIGAHEFVSTGYTLAAAAGSVTLAGTAATLKAARVLGAANGSATLTGTSAALLAGRRLDAQSGTLTLTGTAADLVYEQLGSYVLVAEGDAVALTGAAASLLVGRRLDAASGGVAITGTAADLNYGRAVVGPITVRITIDSIKPTLTVTDA